MSSDIIREINFDITLPQSTEIYFLQVIQDSQFRDYTNYFGAMKILTTNKSNCFRFISIGLDIALFNLLSQQKFDEFDEKLLSFCCLHMIDFKLQSQYNQNVFPFSFFMQWFDQTSISVQNKFNFFVIYSKYCYNDEESHQMSQYLDSFTKYFCDPKICRKLAWIMYYISRNNIENMRFFIHFFAEIRFEGYEFDQNFLKPYLMLCLYILKVSSTSNFYNISNEIVEDLFDNQNDLFDIALSTNDSLIYTNIYQLLIILYQIKIQKKDENLTKCANSLIESKILYNLIHLCKKSDYNICELIFKFLSLLLPFISEIKTLMRFANLVPKMVEMIKSGSDVKPYINIIDLLIEKLTPNANSLQKLFDLIVENEVSDQIRSIIYEYNIDYPDLLEKCDLLDQICNSKQ